MNCVICGNKLTGNRKKFCSNKCRYRYHYNNPNTYYQQVKRGYIRKLELIRLKGGKCTSCGYDKNIAALEFHHIDMDTKSFNVDRRTLSNRTWESILEEAEKCELMCANCHREKHNPECNIENVERFIKESPTSTDGYTAEIKKTGTDCPVCGTNFKKMSGKKFCSKECRIKYKQSNK